MKSYGKMAKRRQIKNAVREEMHNYAEHFDLCTLYTLHREFGFGATRLKRFYTEFQEVYEDFKRRYYHKDDIKEFGSRTDAYMMKEKLLELGFDYDEMVKELTNE